MYIKALVTCTPLRLQQSIKNIGRIPVFTDFLKSSCSISMVDVHFTLDDLNEFCLDPTGNFSRATGEELKAV
jgi:hypothetical protein